MNEEVKAPEGKTSLRTVIGRVVSDKMNKSVSVSVERVIKHPVYGKYVRRTSKVMAHDETNDCKTGDLVAICECRPISRNKAWKVVDVVERAVQE
jgi:small subunit ribosomal protein S17